MITPTRQLPFVEFVALIALLFSVVAFSIDSMLPALPEIAGDLGLSDINRAQLVIAVFFIGSGLGQLVMGPLSDAIGRRPVILGGLLLYMLFSFVAFLSTSLELLLFARFVQGVGVSAPRTVSMALIRDLHVGRVMAQIMSLSMVLFVLVPAVAPLIGQTIIDQFGWRSIFLSFMLFGAIIFGWLYLRQPETHPAAARRPMSLANYRIALVEVVSTRITMTYAFVLSLGLAAIMGYLVSAQQTYDIYFDRGAAFPFWFAMVALASGPSGFLNAALVRRYGMRRIVTVTLACLLLFSLVVLACFALPLLAGDRLFWLFLVWSTAVFWSAGLTMGNLQSLVMEPMGHVAGMAAAITGALSTVLGAALAVPIGLAFDGTPMPLFLGIAALSALALALMLTDPKGRTKASEAGTAAKT